MPSAQELLWTGFRGLDAAEVDLPFRPGGLILFARNLDPDPTQGPARCRALIDGLQARFGTDLPLAVALDQEGGPVSRLRPWVGATPPLRRIWLGGGAAACEAWGRLWGEGLRLLGFNVDFAPVVDLWDGHPGAGIGDRAASGDPGETMVAAGAFLHGLESLGVRGCLKHFPGLGGTTLDSHLGLPELADAAQVGRNAAAFTALAHPDRLVMVAHLRTPASGTLPASLHRGSVAANPWGIQGRFLPDDLEMGGCADWSWPERVRLSLEAGHQWLLVCQTPEGWTACAEAVGTMPDTLCQGPLQATRNLRRNLPPPPGDSFAPDAWQDWLMRLLAAAEEV
ncbi:glycoside hydrolase family 3 N-terminal domain-containing protein [Geothrix sp.]|jgi:beta-N-acetylhexosaminidase|uniref:glycoside hydrolase family 3 N-terminal domain-containing protein n=1 Tax=Geothrix sp. TaxID=1962974 RepID=UPI0025BCB957|nr:glycoside hydrolase family 3 N-terminal domain-containing protein [Geothrix sp.]